MDKTVVVINGKGGSGKDTFCKMTSEIYKINNVSSIKPIFDIAFFGGWDGVKDKKGRLLLAELKKIFDNYNNLSRNYIYSEYLGFMEDTEKEILFVQIREPYEIKLFLEKVLCKKMTLLIMRDDKDIDFGNLADNQVHIFKYSHYFNNEYSNLDSMREAVINFWNSIY